jgi:hypothetical protein
MPLCCPRTRKGRRGRTAWVVGTCPLQSGIANATGRGVSVVDTATWEEVLRMADARNAFVIPIGPRMVHWHEGE